MCGPAAADFDCRNAKSACPSYVGCGGAGVGNPTCSETYRPIVAVGTDLSEEKYYLRYGANSTTFFWLVPGDRVKRWGYKSGGTLQLVLRAGDLRRICPQRLPRMGAV